MGHAHPLKRALAKVDAVFDVSLQATKEVRPPHTIQIRLLQALVGLIPTAFADLN
jgi:hypothetical protein